MKAPWWEAERCDWHSEQRPEAARLGWKERQGPGHRTLGATVWSGPFSYEQWEPVEEF